jgi:hypothetical protein
MLGISEDYLLKCKKVIFEATGEKTALAKQMYWERLSLAAQARFIALASLQLSRSKQSLPRSDP